MVSNDVAERHAGSLVWVATWMTLSPTCLRAAWVVPCVLVTVPRVQDERFMSCSLVWGDAGWVVGLLALGDVSHERTVPDARDLEVVVGGCASEALRLTECGEVVGRLATERSSGSVLRSGRTPGNAEGVFVGLHVMLQIMWASHP